MPLVEGNISRVGDDMRLLPTIPRLSPLMHALPTEVGDAGESGLRFTSVLSVISVVILSPGWSEGRRCSVCRACAEDAYVIGVSGLRGGAGVTIREKTGCGSHPKERSLPNVKTSLATVASGAGLSATGVVPT